MDAVIPNMQLIMEPILNLKVTAKIRVLYDCHLRLTHNIQPLPSGTDIANTVKYFSQTLLSVLKDVPTSPYEMLKDPSKDHLRMALYPNLDYKGLFNAISQLVDSAAHIQYGIQAFGQAILQCLGCLLPFLEYDIIDHLPYLVAYCMAVFPVCLHQEIINLLCYYVLPFTITRRYDAEEESQASQSVAAIIMMVFQHSNNPGHHCQLLECLMSMKSMVSRDVICVIAYGTSVARLAAARLLFYCWPPFSATLHDKRDLLSKLYTEQEVLPCQREGCGGPGGTPAEASKVCYSHSVSVTYAPDRPPPLYLCIECANDIHREHPAHSFTDMLHAMHPPSLVCESKNCRSTERVTYSICFSNECATFNGNRPIRYCLQCHGNRHNLHRGMEHVFHTRLQKQIEPDLVEAIVSLLHESKPINMEDMDCVNDQVRSGVKVELPDPISIEDRQLLGRYGVWLMVGLCTPTPDTPAETIERLLTNLFHWFHVTSYAYTGEISEVVESVKWGCAVEWACSVGGATQAGGAGGAGTGAGTGAGAVASVVRHTAHCPHAALPTQLARLYCLMPYGIITQEIWDEIMPEWMDAICTTVPEKELYQLKTVIGKIFEPECPLVGIDEKQMYRFAAIRFIENPTPETVIRPLQWFQTLTFMEVKLPLAQLFEWFSSSVVNMPEKIVKSPSEKTLKSDSSPQDKPNNTKDKKESDKSQDLKKDESVKPENLTCCILMLDILLKQMELQRRRINIELVNSDATKLLRLMLKSNQTNTIEHAKCMSEGSCSYCEAAALWHQLSVQLVRKLVPSANAPEPQTKDPWANLQVKKNYNDEEKRSKSLSTPAPTDTLLSTGHTMPVPDKTTVGGVLVHMPHIMTATVETISEQLDMAVSLAPSEQPNLQSAKAITLTDVDVASATAMISTPNIMGMNGSGGSYVEEATVWRTSCGKFHFNITDLPQPLQYVHQLLLTLKSTSRPDVLYQVLQCLQIMILDAGVLSEHKGFLTWLQENLLIENLWSVIEGNRAHVGSAAVKVALAGAAYGNGGEILRAVIQKQFASPDPNIRGAALRRTTMLIRFMEPAPVRTSPRLQSALAYALCALVEATDDMDVCVAQRATLYLPTVHDRANELLLFCLENQFDQVLADRPMILQSLYQLHNTLNDRKILTWQFFLNRFETLLIEAHILNNKTVDLNVLRDMVHDSSTEELATRVRRAQTALSGAGVTSYCREQAQPQRTSFDSHHHIDREKVYNRQFSAPLLKRKTSRFGLGQLLTTQGAQRANTVPECGRAEDPPGISTRNVDVEEIDRETAHLLTFLLMQYLSRSDQAHPTDDKQESQAQAAVLKHLFTLIGYNMTDKTFNVPPYVVRESAVFNAFIANLPQVLDQNHVMGGVLFEPVLYILQYCVGNAHSSNPMYDTVITLEPHIGRQWLLALIIILYKYEYTGAHMCSLVQSLIQIVLNTMESQSHQCKRYIPREFLREVSQPSIKAEQPEPPPPPPTITSTTIHRPPTVRAHWDCRDVDKLRQWSLEQESSESELIAIPETSDKSDTTVHESTAPGSFDDASHFEDHPRLDISTSPSGPSATVSQQAPSNITLVGTRPVHQLSTSSSVSVGSDSSNVKSTPVSSHSVEMWPEQLLQHPASPRTKLVGKQQRIVVGASPDTSHCETQHKIELKSPPLNKQFKTKGLTTPLTTAYASPESPLSKMEVSWGGAQTSTSVAVNKEPIDIPPPERLLPIGTNEKDQFPIFNTLVERVKEVLTVPEESTDKTDSSEPVMVTKQNSVKKLTEPTRNRGSSPRRLARQPALGSPADPELAAPSQTGAHEVTTWWSEPQTNSGLDSNQRTIAVKYRCSECGGSLEQCSMEVLSLCSVTLATLARRHRAQAATTLPQALLHLTKVSGGFGEGRGGGGSVATQVLRTILHNTATNNVFTQIFSHDIPSNEKHRQMFYKSIANAFVDFPDMYPCGPLQLLVDHLNSKKTLPMEQMPTIFNNMALYLEGIAPEALGPVAAVSALWAACDTLMRAAAGSHAGSMLRAAAALLHHHHHHPHKGILEPISKMLSFSVQNIVLKLSLVTDLSAACLKAFSRERDKLLVCRVLAFELMQAMRVKTTIPDENFFVLLQFVLQGHGVTLFLPPQVKPRDLLECGNDLDPIARKALCAGAVDCMRPHLMDLIELLQDPNLLNKIRGSVSKSHVNRKLVCLNEDSLGGVVKVGVAQFVAMELSLERAKGKQHPLLQHTSTPRELADTVGRCRALSWVLFGWVAARGGTSLHTAPPLPPLPLLALCHVADTVQTIMSSYVEQGRPVSPPMSPLFHALILCQLWSIYLEELAYASNPAGEPHYTTVCVLMDFWCIVLPSVMQLMNRTKLLAETINLHFLNLIESLQECNSTVLYRLLPMWTPLLHSPLFPMPRHIAARLAAVRSFPPPTPNPNIQNDSSTLTCGSINTEGASSPRIRRLHRILAKMSQLELQPDSFYII